MTTKDERLRVVAVIMWLCLPLGILAVVGTWLTSPSRLPLALEVVGAGAVVAIATAPLMTARQRRRARAGHLHGGPEAAVVGVDSRRALTYRQVFYITVPLILLSFGAIFRIAKVLGSGWSWPSAPAISIYGQGTNAETQVYRIRKRRTGASS